MYKREGKRGFTIVELLIVVVIIAILAAITIVAYNGLQQRARASAASSALVQAKKKLELYNVDNGTYPTTANLAAAGITSPNDTTYQYTSDGTAYCLTATNATVSYYLNSTTQPSPAAGGCPGHGVGGVGAITNLALVPQGKSFVHAAGTVGLRNGRWFGCGASAGTYASNVSGITPVGNTFARKTWTATPTCNGDTGFDTAQSGEFSVTPGDTYVFSVYMRPSTSKWGNIGVYLYNSSGTYLSRPISSLVQLTANTWSRLSWSYTIASGTASINPVFDIDSSLSNGVNLWAPGDTLDITGMMVTKGSTLYNFADGDSANWVWNGAAGASTSTGPSQ